MEAKLICKDSEKKDKSKFSIKKSGILIFFIYLCL